MSNVPKLRFKQYQEKWKQYKIGEIFERVGKPVDVQDNKKYVEIGIKSHGKGLFYKNSTTKEEIGNKRVFFVEPDCFVVNIVFAWERAVARTTCNETGMIASHRFPMYKPKPDIVSLDYITTYFITKYGQNILILASPGGAGRNKTLGQKEFANSTIFLPSYDEQIKIAALIKTIDEIIAKSRAEVEAWEKRKKGVIKKLFSQEVRFNADDGSEFPEWEEKKLRDITDRITRKNKNNETDIPLTISSIDGLVDQRTYFGKTIASKDMSGYYLLKNGEFAYNKSYSKGFDFGSIKRLDNYEQGALSTLYICFTLKNGYDSKFMVHLFDSQIWKKEVAARCAEGARNHGLLNISANDFFDISVKMPKSITEQQKIADCLSSLDEVIKKFKKELAAWEELKKGLLQQMFI
ncbi:MAG: restriction endonuclease subunit S [Lachnospiraceae bacterium]